MPAPALLCRSVGRRPRPRLSHAQQEAAAIALFHGPADGVIATRRRDHRMCAKPLATRVFNSPTRPLYALEFSMMANIEFLTFSARNVRVRRSPRMRRPAQLRRGDGWSESLKKKKGGGGGLPPPPLSLRSFSRRAATPRVNLMHYNKERKAVSPQPSWASFATDRTPVRTGAVAGASLPRTPPPPPASAPRPCPFRSNSVL